MQYENKILNEKTAHWKIVYALVITTSILLVITAIVS
jgi:hypothetical protein